MTSLHSPALYRIGAVSKLSGVPVPTLRVWQTRYNAFSPTTTAGQHRLYNDEDLRKAALLKSLTSQGHGISQIAGLTPAQLQQLLQTGSDMVRTTAHAAQTDGAAPGAWVLVGHSLARRLQSEPFKAASPGSALRIQQVWADLAEGRDAQLSESPEVLMVAVNSLNDTSAQQIQALSQQHAARQTVVLYGYAQSPALAQLSRAGCLVHKESLNDAALADIIRSTRPPLTRASWLDSPHTPTPPRQFSDAVLQRVANAPNQVLCECPRHVAELIGQLGRFEDYSRDCLNQSPKDTELHTQLNTMAAKARALLEQALQMVAAHEGISLHEQA